MKKNVNKIRKQRGSALLIAILVTGVLMILTLGLSDLVIREIRLNRNLVATGKAYFSAEAGIENALLDLHENFPGYQTNGKVEYLGDKNNPDFHYSYEISNQADSIPYFEKDQLIYVNAQGKIVNAGSAQAMPVSAATLYSLHPEATYNALPLNGSVVIPLSKPIVDGEGKMVGMQNVQNFKIEYYFPWDLKNNPNLAGNAKLIQSLDILRWKIFGHPSLGGKINTTVTDSISDFYPALIDNGPKRPVCIGTKQDIPEPDDNLGASESTTCSLPVIKNGSWSGARECYLADANSSDFDAKANLGQISENIAVQKWDPVNGNELCTMRKFIEGHSQNYLVLTNVVNPAVIDLSNQDIAAGKANIYYRIIAEKNSEVNLSGNESANASLVRDAASIKADGFAWQDQYKQSIDVNIGLSSFLPVFNYSLYRTDSSANPDEVVILPGALQQNKPVMKLPNNVKFPGL